MSRATQSSSKPTPINQLINAITSRQVHIAEYMAYVSDRDEFLFHMQEQMVEFNDDADLYIQWMYTMSFLNTLVEEVAHELFDGPCKLMLDEFKSNAIPGENVLPFLHRASAENSIFLFEIRIGHVKIALQEVQKRWEKSRKEYIDRAYECINPCIEGRNLDLKQQAWTRKMFRVIEKVQPEIVSSDQYVLRFVYPNINDVVRAEGIRIRALILAADEEEMDIGSE